VRVQLVDDEDPAGVRVGVDRRFDMSDEVGFGPRRANPRFSNAPVRHIPEQPLTVCHLPQWPVLDAAGYNDPMVIA